MSQLFWKWAYVVYPPFLRVFERLKIHSLRQPYLVGVLKPGLRSDDIEAYLNQNGFERAILAWKDPGEILSLRKIDKDIFQYHIRLFSDGEFRCHYEYSSEGNPLGHVLEKCFEERPEYFKNLLGEFLVP